MNFQDKLDKAITKNNSLLCVGLDPEPTFKGDSFKGQFEFNKWVIDQTSDLVCCYKPNIAFYAANSLKGLEDLKKTVNYIHKAYAHVPVILDAKRADIGNTSEMYVREIFDFFGADAITVNPYCGFDSLEPFFKKREKGIFILCRTSNPSAADFQDLDVDAEPLYIKVAKKVVQWQKIYKNLSIIVGATYPEEIKKLRAIAPQMTFLVPGVGAQGGNLKATLKNGLRSDGCGLIISSSRGVTYAENPREIAKKLKDEINKYR